MIKRIIISISVMMIVIMCTYVNVKKNTLYDQTAAKRWSQDGGVAQLSLIYPVSDTAETGDMYFVDLAHRIQKQLDDSAYADRAGSKDRTGISFPYAVSITGNVSIVSDTASVDVKAYGVDGDFFVFHPLNMLSGSYLSDDDVMDDGIVIDEEAAWKLFGSSDIEGQTVMIGGIPHLIKGVFKKDDGRFASDAGLRGAMCFLSMDSLKKYGRISGSYDLELILPDPVDGFAMKAVSEVMGEKTEEIILTENSSRYRFGNLVDIIPDRGIRSMNTKGVVLPYYENIARAWEDIFSTVYLFVLILAAADLALLSRFMYKFLRSEKYRVLKKQIRHNIICTIKNIKRKGETL